MNRNDDRIASSDPGLRVRTAVADEYSKIEKEMAIAGAQEVDQFNTQASPGGFSLTRTRVRRAGRRGDGSNGFHTSIIQDCSSVRHALGVGGIQS
jgi:hypothetical protein